jgi:uncharacterized protein with PQ loop repeat
MKHKVPPALEKIVTLIALFYPLTALPQLLEIWVGKDVSGVSLLSWSLFLIVTLILIIYSWLKNEKKLALMWSMWVVMYVGIILGLLVYR